MTDQKASIVIIPCYNEEDYLLATCHSLNFGIGVNFPQPDTYLILVDNNSTDDTLLLAESIKKNSRPQSVIILRESLQGFVPARHAGCTFSVDFAKSLNLALSDVLLIQADADTLYGPNYVPLMKKAAKYSGHNILYQAAVNYPSSFCHEFPKYIEMCELIDSLYMYDNSLELIIDDKVSAFWLEDYIIWGGYTRDFYKGDEIYAETSRLFLKALASNASMHFVEDAFAYHSPRKVIDDPLLIFATAGFPRENSWKDLWHKHNPSTFALTEFSFNSENNFITNAINYRKKHLLALFKILPAHVQRSLNHNFNTTNNLAPFYGIPVTIPLRQRADLRLNPGFFIMDALTVEMPDHY